MSAESPPHPLGPASADDRRRSRKALERLVAGQRALAEHAAARRPVRSITVDGVPGSSRRRRPRRRPRRAPRERPRAAGRATGKVRARRDERAEGVQHLRPGPWTAGTRTPIASGRSALSQRSAAPGSAATSVTGPGRSAYAAIRGARRELRQRASSSSSTEANRSAVGWIGVAALRRVERARRRLAVPVGGEPVDGVGRDDREPARAERGDALASTLTVDVARPSTTRSRPARSRCHRDVRIAVRVEERRDVAAPGRATSSTRRRQAQGRAASRTSVAVCPRSKSAISGSQSRTSGCERVASSSAIGRTAGSRRRGPMASRAALRTGRASRSSTSRPVRSTFSRARASASSETSIAGHPRARVLVGDRERDRARPRADVEHARRIAPASSAQAALDERLGLRSRDQRAPVDGEREPAEAPFAEDVLERLTRARRATSAARPSSSSGTAAVEVHVELDPVEPSTCAEESLGIEPRPLDPFRRVSAERRSTSPIVASVARSQRVSLVPTSRIPCQTTARCCVH